MASHESHRYYDRPIAEHNMHRIIPGRMSNYQEPAPQSRGPNVTTYTRQSAVKRSIPGYRANYLQHTPNATIPERTTICPQNNSGIGATEASALHETVPGPRPPSVITRLLVEDGDVELQTFQ